MVVPTVADLDRTLADAGIPVDGASLIAAMTQVGAMRLVAPETVGPPLADDERDVLIRYSGVEPDDTAAARERTSTAAKVGLMYAEALTTAQVADLLGISSSRVRHLAREQRLYVLPADRRSGLRFPSWQFAGGAAVPGIAQVLVAMPREMHPLEVAGFFTTPTIDLSVDGDTPSTALHWLLTGGDPVVVAELASTLGAAV